MGLVELSPPHCRCAYCNELCENQPFCTSSSWLCEKCFNKEIDRMKAIAGDARLHTIKQGVNAQERSTAIPLYPIDRREYMSVGQVVSTGNLVINSLPIGALLEVTGKGQFTVVEVPEVVVELQKGDRVNTKYGPGTVVGLTSRIDTDALYDTIDGSYDEPVWYIADGTNMVRVAEASSLSKI